MSSEPKADPAVLAVLDAHYASYVFVGQTPDGRKDLAVKGREEAVDRIINATIPDDGK